MIAIDDQRTGALQPERMNLASHVLTAGKAPDDKLAMVVLGADDAEHWTYGQLRHRVMATAAGFLDHAAPGAKVLMRLGNSPDFPIVYLGAIAAGLVPVPTSAALGEDEVTRISIDLGPAVVVAEKGVALPRNPPTVLKPRDLANAPHLAEAAQCDREDLAYIVFTSGTSGTPLGVQHAHRAILARARMFDGWYGLTAQDRVLHAGAFNWTFTLGTGLLDPWTVGATALVLKPDTDPALLPALAERHDATILAGAPGVFRRMLKSYLPPMPHLRHGLAAGEKLPDAVREEWRAATGTDIHEAFGQSECSTFISSAPNRPAPMGTLGYAQPGRCLAILGDDGPTERGQVGRIAISRDDPGLMLGYLGRARITDDWVATGDLGVMRDDGAIEYHGRADDMLTAGGFRVSPLEVEAAMSLHPQIEEAAAVDHKLNPTTTLIALHYTGDPVPEPALRAHAEQHLARYKQPRLFIHEQALPRNANGKLLRKVLRPAHDGAS